MYVSAILLKNLTLKVVRRAYFNNQVTSCDHTIAYALLDFVVVDVKVMINYLAARKLCHAKKYAGVMRHAVHASGCTILYFIRPHIAFIIFSVFYIYDAVGISAIPQSC